MTAAPFRLPLGPDRSAVVHLDDEGRGHLDVSGYAPLAFQLGAERLELAALPPGYPLEALLALLASRFCSSSRVRSVALRVPGDEDLAIAALRQGLFDTLEHCADGHIQLLCRRQTFWQQPLPWLTAPASAHTAPHYVFSGEKRHPQRPPIASGEVYRRYLPGLNTTFSLRTIDPDRDLEVFNRWMNLEHVAFFWEQAWGLREHADYLAQMLADPRVHPLIGCYDDEPFAYFEVYWCAEDRIAPYYDVQAYDRGWHVVVGESKHQGIGKLRGWFRSLMHYMFLDDPRTQRIMGEPRIDHDRQIDFLKSQGFGHLKNIQLPHKKAALLRLERETFFDEHPL